MTGRGVGLIGVSLHDAPKNGVSFRLRSDKYQESSRSDLEKISDDFFTKNRDKFEEMGINLSAKCVCRENKNEDLMVIEMRGTATSQKALDKLIDEFVKKASINMNVIEILKG